MRKDIFFGIIFLCLTLTLISFVPAPNNSTDPQRSCDENSDCVKAVNKSDCCTFTCPSIFNKVTVESDENLFTYELGEDYYSLFNLSRENCTCSYACAAVVTYPVCENNLCKVSMTPPNNQSTLSCIDTDGGINYYERGKIKINGVVQTNAQGEVKDICSDAIGPDGPALIELYCNSSNELGYAFKEYQCPNGCEDGACKLEDDHENNETSDENETDHEDEQKICCLRTITKGNDSYQKYNFIEKEDCLEFNKNTTINGMTKKSEIVDDSLCNIRKINKTEVKEQVRERQRVKFEAKTGVDCPDDCICTGVVMKCLFEDGSREMRVYAGKSGNLIIQIKDTNMTTNITLYKDENGSLYAFNRAGKEKRINFFPDQVKEKIRERIKQKTCDCENITLTDDTKYEVQTKKKARLFWIFPVREKSNVEIDAENGEILKFRNPWWGFLANDNEEE